MAKYLDDNNAKFLNPYNFVSIKNEINYRDNSANDERVTGVINCELVAITPLAILDSASSNGDGHKVYKSFRYGDMLAIPGSSIRGVIRSVYETITSSCMSTVDEDEYLTARSGVKGNRSDPFAPGLLICEDGIWNFYTAERIPLVSTRYKKIYNREEEHKPYTYSFNTTEGGYYFDDENNKCFLGNTVYYEAEMSGHKKNGKEIWGGKSVSRLLKAEENDKKGKKMQIGYIYVGESIGNKHADSIFIKKECINGYDVDKAMDALDNVVNMYQSKSINKGLNYDEESQHTGYKGYQNAKKRGVIPVWYSKEAFKNNKLILSMASIGRFAFHNNMGQLINNHKKCSSRDRLCPACSIFGMTSTNGESLGSKIRITDALDTEKKNKTIKNVLLKELGAPRPSYIQFYSVGGKSYNEDGAQIRGRKYYYHIPKASKYQSIYSLKNNENNITDRNQTVELIDKGSKFYFSLYYDDITFDELKVLKYVISNLMHKIGHGKPLGLGSVKINISNEYQRTFSNSYDVKKIENKDLDINNVGFIDQDALKEVQAILNFDFVRDIDVKYPYIKPKEGYQLKENVTASHQWFKNNTKELPEIGDVKKSLCAKYISEIDPNRDIKMKNNNNSSPHKKSVNEKRKYKH